MNKAVFLDRDGVLNPDPGYISSPQQFVLYPYAARAVALLNQLHYKVIVVTNQSGVARGLFTISQINDIHSKMKSDLASSNAFIDHIYFSPWHKDGIIEPYNIDHPDRKPDTGMFLQAQKDFDLDPSASFMIGDRLSDMIFAHKAKLRPVLVLSGDGKKDLLQRQELKNDFAPEFIAQDLMAAALLIKLLDKG